MKTTASTNPTQTMVNIYENYHIHILLCRISNFRWLIRFCDFNFRRSNIRNRSERWKFHNLLQHRLSRLSKHKFAEKWARDSAANNRTQLFRQCWRECKDFNSKLLRWLGHLIWRGKRLSLLQLWHPTHPTLCSRCQWYAAFNMLCFLVESRWSWRKWIVSVSRFPLQHSRSNRSRQLMFP